MAVTSSAGGGLLFIYLLLYLQNANVFVSAVSFCLVAFIHNTLTAGPWQQCASVAAAGRYHRRSAAAEEPQSLKQDSCGCLWSCKTEEWITVCIYHRIINQLHHFFYCSKPETEFSFKVLLLTDRGRVRARSVQGWLWKETRCSHFKCF